MAIFGHVINILIYLAIGMPLLALCLWAIDKVRHGGHDKVKKAYFVMKSGGACSLVVGIMTFTGICPPNRYLDGAMYAIVGWFLINSKLTINKSGQ